MFLDNIKPFSVKQWPERERDISHWLKAAKCIPNITDPEEALRYLQVELATRRRPLLVDRLYRRFSHLRCLNEFNDLIVIFQHSSVIPFYPEYDKMLISWDHVYPVVSTYEPKDANKILDLLHYEWSKKRRLYLMKRLMTKYQSLRRCRERKEMMAWNLKRVPSSTCENVSANLEVKRTSLPALSVDLCLTGFVSCLTEKSGS